MTKLIKIDENYKIFKFKCTGFLFFICIIVCSIKCHPPTITCHLIATKCNEFTALKYRFIKPCHRDLKVPYAQLIFTKSCDGGDLTEGPSADFILGHNTELVHSGRKKISDQQIVLSGEVWERQPLLLFLFPFCWYLLIPEKIMLANKNKKQKINFEDRLKPSSEM